VLDWSQRTVLSTPVSGVVSKVAVSPGERVAAGQLLLQFDQRPFESALQDASAQLRKHGLQRDEARRELERTRELYERTVISVHDLSLQEINFAVEEADYSSAVVALDTAKLQLEYSTLQAPYAGLVLYIEVSAGMTVINTQQATPLVTLAQDRPMRAVAQVPATALDDLAAGQTVSVIVNDKRFDGKLDKLAAEPDSSGQYSLGFSFDPGETGLRSGLPVLVRIP